MAAVKGDQYRDDLTISKRHFSVSYLAITCIKLVFTYFGLLFSTVVIHLNENFNNFIRSKHIMLFFKLDT